MRKNIKKFLFLSQFFPPETGAGSKRMAALADALSKQYSLTIVTLKPGYPHPQLFDNIDLEQIDQGFDFNIKRAFHFAPHSGALFIRGFREMIMSARLMFSALKVSTDVILVSTPSMFLGPMARLLARWKRVYLIWDVRDLTWRYGRESVELNILTRWLTPLLEKWMRSELRKADVVVGATPGVTDLLVREHDVPEERTFTVLNGVSREFFDSFSDQTIISAERPIVLYIGLLGHNHGMDILLDVATMMPQLEFLVVGDGTEKAKIEQRLSVMNLSNFTLKDYCIDQADIIRYYKTASVLINHTRSSPVLNDTVIPAKFSEYMASGKPFVYAGEGLAVRFLEDIGAARLAQPENPEDLMNAIAWVLNNPAEAIKMGQQGRAYVDQFLIREELMERYTEEIKTRLL